MGWDLSWFGLDPPGKIVLLTISALYFCCAWYAPGYLRLREDRVNRMFVTALLLMLATMSLIAASQHVGLMWVAIEATTLASGTLIYFNRTPQAIEATWKYLLIGSVGIALALLGTFFLGFSAILGDTPPSLMIRDLVQTASRHSPHWLDAAFVTLLVGYGTKMGLAPMHTWKPDAYGEAPGIVGALLAGGLTSCSFLAILRIVKVMGAAGRGAFAADMLVGIGLFSMATGAVFMVRQRDYKRALAYSSVEHMGILALGIGLGGAGIFGALLHLVNNALTKGVLFLSSGNIHRAYGSKSTEDVSGALSRLPASGALFVAGFFAVTGSPPFGPFISEFTIVRAAFAAQRYGVGALILVLLLAVFIGMGGTVLAVVQGRDSSAAPREGTVPFRDTAATVVPIVILLALVLMLGLYIPAPLHRLLDEATAYLDPGHPLAAMSAPAATLNAEPHP
jgi:hydrogenase-4 component F